MNFQTTRRSLKNKKIVCATSIKTPSALKTDGLSRAACIAVFRERLQRKGACVKRILTRRFSVNAYRNLILASYAHANDGAFYGENVSLAREIEKEYNRILEIKFASFRKRARTFADEQDENGVFPFNYYRRVRRAEKQNS